MGLFEMEVLAYELNIGEDGRDRGEIETRLIYRDPGIAVKRDQAVYSFKDPDVHFDIFKGADVRGNAAEGAAVGGLFFGVAGALVGALAASGGKSWILEIKTPKAVRLFRLPSDEIKKSVEKRIVKARGSVR